MELKSTEVTSLKHCETNEICDLPMNLIYFNTFGSPVEAGMIWLIMFEELLALKANFVLFQTPRKSLECFFVVVVVQLQLSLSVGKSVRSFVVIQPHLSP